MATDTMQMEEENFFHVCYLYILCGVGVIWHHAQSDFSYIYLYLFIIWSPLVVMVRTPFKTHWIVGGWLQVRVLRGELVCESCTLHIDIISMDY